MASVRHLGFVMTSSYYIAKLHLTFPTFLPTCRFIIRTQGGSVIYVYAKSEVDCSIPSNVIRRCTSKIERKSPIFTPPVYLTPPLMELPLEFCIGAGVSEN